MKSYNHLFEKLISKENIKLAITNSSKGKRNRPEVKEIFENMDKYICKYQSLALNYKNCQHKPKEIYDGIRRKKRTIIVPKYDEQVMHHMIVNVMKPIFMKGMYEHSYGSIPNRGAHKAKKFIDKWIEKDIKNTRYCLQMDIRKFFDSVPHDILKEKLSNIVHDERFLNILFKIIDVVEIGIPLGFYTSQWFANFYLSELDHIIKEKMNAPYYVRYMDDMVILSSNKRNLHAIRKQIENFLNQNLGLELKSNWQIFKIEYIDKNGQKHGRALDFMGFRFFRNRTILRKKIMLRISRKARKLFHKDKPSIRDCRQFSSYIGWISCTDTYNFYLKWIQPILNIQYLKRRISNYDKKGNRKCGTKQNMTMSLAY